MSSLDRFEFLFPVFKNKGVFPESAGEVPAILTKYESLFALFFHLNQPLSRLWSGQMDKEKFAEISETIPSLYRGMKNVMEMVFAASPLLALSTHSWAVRTINRTYLLRVGLDFVYY